MDLDELNDALAESNQRARSGRAMARAIFAATAVLVAFLLILVATTPADIGPLRAVPEPFSVKQFGFVAAPGIGIAAGLTWMWRILRADPEPDARSWRYLHRP